MEVSQLKMKLDQNENKKSQIRTVQLPGRNCHYYSKQNFLTQFDNFQFDIYLIHENKVVLEKRQTQQLRSKFQHPKQVLQLENHIVAYNDNQFNKFNIENLEQCQIYQGSLKMQRQIYCYGQINEKSFMTTTYMDFRKRIYQLRNLKQSHTSFNKFGTTSIQYYKHMLQGFTGRHLYYYNTRMTKQIRKYYNQNLNEPIFNSNYLFVPKYIYQQQCDFHYWVHITIYDIQSMKRKGTLVTIDRNQLILNSCIFIRDLNVVAVLYQTWLYLYDFTTLKLIDSEKINTQQHWKKIMKYDEYNGLTIFLQIF